jgi:tetratricopeptide (TPR) repeat protein
VSDRFTVTQIAEVDGYADEGRPLWHMIRSVLGIEAFGINAWTATADGQEVIGEHDEIGQGAGRHEELYVVVTGTARFTLDGEEVEAPAGTVVHVPDPNVRRSAVADAGTTILVIGGRRGEAFEVSPWERSAEALRFWPTGDWERAIAVLLRQHVEHPENAGVLYNLACAEARFGRADDALEHLRQAVELEPRFLDNARDDGDLESIREDERFPS